MNQEPDLGNLMPDTFADIGNNSYGAAIDDYQAQMSDYDLRGPNAQFIGSNASYDEEENTDDPGIPGPCDAALEEALEKIECLEDLVLPEDLNGEFSWYHQSSSTRPDYGPPPINPYPACTKTISSQFSVRWVTGSDVEFARFNVAPPISECAATGSIEVSVDDQLRNPPVGIPISWSFVDGYSSTIQTIALNKTYHVWARGVNLNENSYSEPYVNLGSFTITEIPPENPGDDPTAVITRSIDVTNTFTEGEKLPCGIASPTPEPRP